MIKITYIQNHKGKRRGDTEMVSNNIAHGLFEEGIAGPWETDIFKDISGPPMDKMMKPQTRGEVRAERKIKRENKEYKTK